MYRAAPRSCGVLAQVSPRGIQSRGRRCGARIRVPKGCAHGSTETRVCGAQRVSVDDGGEKKLFRRARKMIASSRQPDEWGSRFWFVMHTVAYYYPHNPSVDDMTSVRHFFESFGRLLPCRSCRNHYRELLRTNPIDEIVQDRMALLRWIHMVHNRVNARLGKPELSWDDYAASFQYLDRPSVLSTRQRWGALIALITAGVGFIYYHNTGTHRRATAA